MMKKLAIAAVVLAAAAAAAWRALLPQRLYAKMLLDLGAFPTLVVPVEAGYHERVAAAAREGKRVHELAAPTFTYLPVRHEGRTLSVRPAYSEKEAPEGAFVTMSLLGFMRSAAEDPKAEGAAVNPGVVKAPFSAVLAKDQAQRVVASLRRRGYRE